MTDPVVPPQPGAPSFPPPNPGGLGSPPPNTGGPGFPPPNAGGPGFPPPPNAGGPGYPPPNAGAAGFPPPNAGAPFPGTETKPKKKFLGKFAGILGVLVVIVVVAVVKIGLGSLFAKDPTADAKAGDCIATKSAMTETVSEIDAEITECSSADAAFTVLGRIDGTNDVNGSACDATFNAKLKEGEDGFVIGSEKTDGYLLCLTPAAKK